MTPVIMVFAVAGALIMLACAALLVWAITAAVREERSRAEVDARFWQIVSELELS